MTLSARVDGILGVALKLLLQNMSQHPFQGTVRINKYMASQAYILPSMLMKLSRKCEGNIALSLGQECQNVDSILVILLSK